MAPCTWNASYPVPASSSTALHDAGVVTAIVSGGIRSALLPLAGHLGIPAARVLRGVAARERRTTHVLDTLDGAQPLATQSGKITVVRSLLADGLLPAPVALAGDGATDAAARGEVQAFIAFTGVVRRPAVVAEAAAEAGTMAALRDLLLP